MAELRARRLGAVLCVLLAGAAIGLLGCSKKKPKADAGATQPTNGSPSIAGPLGTGVNLPLVNPPEPRINFDVAALGFDPYKPDMTLSIPEWPRRKSRVGSIPQTYIGKIMATRGRIYRMFGYDESDRVGKRTGVFQFWFMLINDGENIAGADGKYYYVDVNLARGQDWHQFRPGKVLKVAGRASSRTKTEITNLDLSDAVVLSVQGEGNPTKTIEQAMVDEQKRYGTPNINGLALVAPAPDTVLTGVVSSKPNSKSRKGTLYVNLVQEKKEAECMITNELEFNSNPPMAGDTVTLIGTASYNSTEKRLDFRGLYIPKK